MSTFDQTGEQYWTATGKAPRYKQIGWFAVTTTSSTDGVEASADNEERRTKSQKGEYKMFEETTEQSVRHNEHGSGCQCGCGSQTQTAVAADEKAASEQAARDEVVRARNKRVRAPRSAPGPDGPPPFSDHSGQL
jgi:hypothetical protein